MCEYLGGSAHWPPQDHSLRIQETFHVPEKEDMGVLTVQFVCSKPQCQDQR